MKTKKDKFVGNLNNLKCRPVTEIPGIGIANGSRLKQNNYFSVLDVMIEFLMRDEAGFKNWLHETCGAYKSHQDNCFQGLRELCINIMKDAFPELMFSIATCNFTAYMFQILYPIGKTIGFKSSVMDIFGVPLWQIEGYFVLCKDQMLNFLTISAHISCCA
ncbi:uncharacterized protein LOC134272300 [Saccostrea cucullata]|uniref:uncharacterized protein LOC134272300 n=1 Tax=Saccostrea cuccullata TaxID=36930 RepID=UPI002ED16430